MSVKRGDLSPGDLILVKARPYNHGVLAVILGFDKSTRSARTCLMIIAAGNLQDPENPPMKTWCWLSEVVSLVAKCTKPSGETHGQEAD